MVRMLASITMALALAACSGGAVDSGAADMDEIPDDPVGVDTTADGAGDAQSGDASGDTSGDEPASTPEPDVTVGPYDQVEIAPFWLSSVGETEPDDGSMLGTLEFAGELPAGTAAMLVPLYVHNGSQEDIDVRDAVEPTFVTATGAEYGAESSCGSFLGSYDDGQIIEWAEAETVWVCRLVPDDAAAGGQWRIAGLVAPGRTYYVTVP